MHTHPAMHISPQNPAVSRNFPSRVSQGEKVQCTLSTQFTGCQMEMGEICSVGITRMTVRWIASGAETATNWLGTSILMNIPSAPISAPERDI